MLIFISVIPLLQTVTGTLLQRAPQNLKIDKIFRAISSVEGVVRYYDVHFWSNNSDIFVGSVHVVISNTSSEQKILSKISAILKQHTIYHTAIQIEKEQVNPVTGLPSQIK